MCILLCYTLAVVKAGLFRGRVYNSSERTSQSGCLAHRDESWYGAVLEGARAAVSVVPRSGRGALWPPDVMQWPRLLEESSGIRELAAAIADFRWGLPKDWHFNKLVCCWANSTICRTLVFFQSYEGLEKSERLI